MQCSIRLFFPLFFKVNMFLFRSVCLLLFFTDLDIPPNSTIEVRIYVYLMYTICHTFISDFALNF